MAFNRKNKKASKDEWITPRYITEALGGFDLDPCAPHPDKAPWRHATISYHKPEHDGLALPWHGRVWLNPPYNNQAAWAWIKRLEAHSRDNNPHEGGIALINATPGTIGFQEYILKHACSIFWIAGRVRFYNVDGTKAGTPMQDSCLVSFCYRDSEILRNCKLRGEHTWLQRDRFQPYGTPEILYQKNAPGSGLMNPINSPE